MKTFKRIVHSKAGQGITELALIIPLLLLLALGAIEVSNMINSYLTLTHLTREGANSISRGIAPADDGSGSSSDTDCASPDDALDAIVVSASPIIRCTNQEQWVIFYSLIDDVAIPGVYDVTEQIQRGILSGETSKVGGLGSLIIDMSNVSPGQSFVAIEVYYNYAPDSCGGTFNCPLTPLQSFTGKFFTPINLPTVFYDRTIFTVVG